MNEEIFSTFAVETKKALAPVQDFNQLVVDNAEKLVALQIASVQNYYALGFANVKALLEVNDAEAFKAYIGKHSEFVNSVSEQFAGDVKAVAVGQWLQRKGSETRRGKREGCYRN